MEYFSTRNAAVRIGAPQAVINGLAPDGGLYVPAKIPTIGRETLAAMCRMDYRGRSEQIIGRYLSEYTAEEIRTIVAAAYGDNFNDAAIAPIRFIDPATGFLELWHGPTCAFKDMALQMLPHLMTSSLEKCGENRKVCILVATSGDTGKAALEGFADVPGTKILVFYPRDGVSDVQRLQMLTQTGENVLVCAVDGNFDDAQSGVKTIFGDKALAEQLSERGWFLSSANSINWGRLLPQIVYYFSAYCDFVNAGRIAPGAPLNFSVPTGNFGNILAGWYAKRMGLPVNRFICASNENNVLTEFITTGVYDRNRPFHTTISPSMDILISSNLERLLYAITGSDVQVADCMRALKESGRYEVSAQVQEMIRKDFAAGFCSDGETKAEIAKVWSEKGYLMDTHTAVGHKVLADYRAASKDKTPAVVVSTASPFKFCDSVLSALGEDVSAPGTELIRRLETKTGISAPAALRGLAGRPVRFGGCVKKKAMQDIVMDFLR